MKLFSLCLVCLICMVFGLYGEDIPTITIIYVDGSNTSSPWSGTQQDPYQYIQDALDVAQVGRNAIHVLPGTYFENIDFLGKDILVKSTGGASSTIINGGQVAPCVIFDSGEGAAAKLKGFTLTNGGYVAFTDENTDYRGGGGVFVDRSSPTILECAFYGNYIYVGEAGLSVGSAICVTDQLTPTESDYFSSVKIKDCIFTGNFNSCYGVVYLFHQADDAEVVDNIFFDNDGIVYLFPDCISSIEFGTGASIQRNIFYSEEDTSKVIRVIGVDEEAVFSVSSNLIIGSEEVEFAREGIFNFTNNTCVNMLATALSVHGSYPGGEVTLNCYNNIFYESTIPNQPDILLYETSGDIIATVDYCLVEDGINNVSSVGDVTLTFGVNNVDVNPGFVDAVNFDFHLDSDSDLIDEGYGSAPGLPSNDFEGDARVLDGVPDIGADETHY